MRSLVAILIATAMFFAGPAAATIVGSETYVEEWDAKSQTWVRVHDDRSAVPVDDAGANRLAGSPSLPDARMSAPAIARYGPFRVVDETRAELVAITDRATPLEFAAMMRDFPAIATLSMVEAPGTDDDRANLRLGRLIRDAGIATHVPAGGSVRSGAVELFLAGERRHVEDGAEFAVHSWIDPYGMEPSDYAMDAPANAMYLDYYRDMGMSDAEAYSFYDMTNSVDFSGARWLTAQDMRGWIGQEVLSPVQTTAEAAHREVCDLDSNSWLA